jgi:hypothetical protein
MARLIPSFGSCRWDSPGERRFAERLLSHLEDDYLCWFNVPMGSQRMHPDFVILHPRRGILIVEVKDWKLETIQSINKTSATLLTDRGAVTVPNPLFQARQYAYQLTAILQRDPQLLHELGSPHAGKLAFPWGYGAALTNITRKQFSDTDLGEALPSDSVICKDEMLEAADPEAFQRRLWDMFTQAFPCTLSLPQLDRIRWHMYPEIRVRERSMGMFEEKPELASPAEPIPDLIRVMDMQQEQLARSLGEGHRIIHGVAGSGKTMILGYRCQYLAQSSPKPVLVLCYNRSLAAKLSTVIVEQRLQGRVCVRTFHSWCREQLVTYHSPMPSEGPSFFQQLVDGVISGVDRGQIPRAQYSAILIDEGHDFEADWLRLVVQMIDPVTNSLLLMYDDAQSLYGKQKRALRFSEVGIQARGRSTILRLNYRNTSEVLKVAYEFAREVIAPSESEDDGIPVVSPQSSGRHGPVPTLARLETVLQEVSHIVARTKAFHSAGHRWSDIAVLYRNGHQGTRLEAAFAEAMVPVALHGGGVWDVNSDSVKLLTMHSSKGLEFPIVIVAGLCEMPTDQTKSIDEARLLYVAMTRAMNNLEMTHHRVTPITLQVQAAIAMMA